MCVSTSLNTEDFVNRVISANGRRANYVADAVFSHTGFTLPGFAK